MLGRSFSWLDQRLRAGQFVLPDGNTVQPLRTPGGYRRFTLQMLRDMIVASARQGWFSAEDTRFALRELLPPPTARPASTRFRADRLISRDLGARFPHPRRLFLPLGPKAALASFTSARFIKLSTKRIGDGSRAAPPTL